MSAPSSHTPQTSLLGRRLPLALAAVLALSVFSLFAADEEKPINTADLLPDGTIMFAEIAPWSHWSKDFSKTSLAQIFAEPEVRQFLAGPFSQISYLIKHTTGDAKLAAPDANAPPVAPAPPVPPAPAVQKKPDGAVPNAISSMLDVASQFTSGPFSVAVRFSPDDAQAGRMPAVAVISRA